MVNFLGYTPEASQLASEKLVEPASLFRGELLNFRWTIKKGPLFGYIGDKITSRYVGIISKTMQ